MRVTYLLSFLGVLVATPQTYAQKSYAVGIGGGPVIPVGRLSDIQKTGYSALLVVAAGSPEMPVGIRLDGMYNNLNRGPTSPATASGNFRIACVLANLVYALPGSYAKPYLLAGGGWYSAKVDTSGAKAQGNFGFNSGLGMTFTLGPAAAFIEARYHTVSRSEDKGGVFQFVPITVGLMF